jgi:outer membrane lipoprotein LolB
LRQAVFRNAYFLLLLLYLLNACTAVSVKEPVSDSRAAYQNRFEKLSSISEWGLVGKISLDDGDRGGSGRLQWDVKTDSSELDFHGALGRGAWHLQINPEGAILKEANGNEQAAPGVNALIQARIGWPIPVDALQWWVRGLAAPGAIEDEQLDTEGLLKSLHQFGWRVDFNRYRAINGALLPIRLDARRDNYRVKLAIGHWRMDMGHAASN